MIYPCDGRTGGQTDGRTGVSIGLYSALRIAYAMLSRDKN